MQPSLQRRGPVCMQREEGRGAYAYVREEADGACCRAHLQSNLPYVYLTSVNNLTSALFRLQIFTT